MGHEQGDVCDRQARPLKRLARGFGHDARGKAEHRPALHLDEMLPRRHRFEGGRVGATPGGQDQHSATRPGGAQQSYDKQFLRDYLLSLKWDKAPPAPQLPEEIVRKTREKYLEAYERLVGKPLQS